MSTRKLKDDLLKGESFPGPWPISWLDIGTLGRGGGDGIYKFGTHSLINLFIFHYTVFIKGLLK